MLTYPTRPTASAERAGVLDVLAPSALARALADADARDARSTRRPNVAALAAALALTNAERGGGAVVRVLGAERAEHYADALGADAYGAQAAAIRGAAALARRQHAHDVLRAAMFGVSA